MANKLPARFVEEIADRYRILREIGSGGMATVYLADDLKHDRPVAVKVLRTELGDSIGADRFAREVQIVAHLNHPHVLPLLDSGEAGGLLYYVMPYVDGESLRHKLAAKKQLGLDETVKLTTEVADALDYAHAHGVVHRDIKPENILLEEGHAIVADFGIAKAVATAGAETLTNTGIAVGSPFYMSPEQAAGEHDVDGRSDQYSLACVVYEMLVGEHVFDGTTARAILARHMHERVPSVRLVRPSVSPTMEKVLETALAKVPADRFESVREFAQRLAKGAARRGIGVPKRVAQLVALLLILSSLVYGVTRLIQLGGSQSRFGNDQPIVDIMDPTRIAVLYFEDLSRTGDLGYIARGLTEDLIRELSWVDALKVTSPEGVRPFRGSDVSVDSVARHLAVGSIVGGSVAQSGDRLRVRVRLIDAATAEELFSRNFEGRADELFALQDTLSDEVARFLRERLGREIRLRERMAETNSQEAWTLVNRGEELASVGSRLVRTGSLEEAARTYLEADSLLVEAEQLGPDWSAPTLLRARIAYSMSFVSPAPADMLPLSAADSAAVGSGLSVHWLRRGIDHTNRVLVRDSLSAAALAQRGELRYRTAAWIGAGRDSSMMQLAEADMAEAVAIDPRLARAWYTLGELQYMKYSFAEALVSLANAYQADAYLTAARDIIQSLFYSALEVEQYEDARQWCETGRNRFPDDPRFMDCEIVLLGWSGRGMQHINTARQLLASITSRDSLNVLMPKRAHQRIWIAAIYARTGLRDGAFTYIDSARAIIQTNPETSTTAHIEAYVRLLLGQKRESLRLLATYLEDSPERRDHVERSPWFKSIRGDPEFVSLFTSVN